MRTCVIGGGLMGMALARRLAMDGQAVTVLEAADKIGGLATWDDYDDFSWDRFYHVILPTDRSLIRFVSDIGLDAELEWQRTYTGFFVDDRLHSISSNLEFLKFPLLSLLSKARLAWTMLYCSRIEDWQRLEKETVESFLLRVSGRETYEKLWKPLLLAKLGKHYERVSAVFIWSYVKRMFSARDKSASAEHLGHVSGGYRMIFRRLKEDILARGGAIRTGVRVHSVSAESDQGLRVETQEGSVSFDQVINTCPVTVLRKTVDPNLLEIRREGSDVEYLGVVCPLVVSREPLVPFYVVNIADSRLPFTGVIGMSTVINRKNTGGKYLTYLPRYVLSSDEYLDRSDEEIREEFLTGIRRMLPSFDPSSIEAIHVNRARIVQPLQVVDYSSLVPQVETRHPRLYVLNTSQFVNSTLNNNEVIRTVYEFYDQYRERLLEPATRG